jgi:hypothetical protein
MICGDEVLEVLFHVLGSGQERVCEHLFSSRSLVGLVNKASRDEVDELFIFVV